MQWIDRYSAGLVAACSAAAIGATLALACAHIARMPAHAVETAGHMGLVFGLLVGAALYLLAQWDAKR